MLGHHAVAAAPVSALVIPVLLLLGSQPAMGLGKLVFTVAQPSFVPGHPALSVAPNVVVSRPRPVQLVEITV